MSWLLGRFARSSWALSLVLVFLAVPATVAHAQFMGYGYPGYGYGGLGYGGLSYGYGGGFGYGGLGYGGLGYGGLGYGGFGYGGFGYGGGFTYGGPGISIAVPGPYGVTYGYGSLGYGALNPLFGVGLTPLGVNSALTERYLLGRGTPGYSSSYGTVPLPRSIGGGIGTVIVPVPVPGSATVPGTAPGTEVKRP